MHSHALLQLLKSLHAICIQAAILQHALENLLMHCWAGKSVCVCIASEFPPRVHQMPCRVRTTSRAQMCSAGTWQKPSNVFEGCKLFSGVQLPGRGIGTNSWSENVPYPSHDAVESMRRTLQRLYHTVQSAGRPHKGMLVPLLLSLLDAGRLPAGSRRTMLHPGTKLKCQYPAISLERTVPAAVSCHCLLVVRHPLKAVHGSQG